MVGSWEPLGDCCVVECAMWGWRVGGVKIVSDLASNFGGSVTKSYSLGWFDGLNASSEKLLNIDNLLLLDIVLLNAASGIFLGSGSARSIWTPLVGSAGSSGWWG